MNSPLPFLLIVFALAQPSVLALPVAITNPSGETNSGVDRAALPSATTPGWEGFNCQTILGRTAGGNGAWRVSLNPGSDLRQLTSHVIQTGDAFSFRFDAATFSGLPPSVTAELYTESVPGTVTVIHTQAFLFATPLTVANWESFQLLTAHGQLDAHAGKRLGIRLRTTAASGQFLSADNLRLQAFPSTASVTNFSHSWAALPDRPWAGPSFWANRLQDWEVLGGRLQTRQGESARPLRTIHLLTTAVGEQPGNFTLSVRVGNATATWGVGAQCGFVVGAGATLDYRGAALVHHKGGRDGGLFLGVNNAGRAVIQDNRVSGYPQLALGGTATSVPNEYRLELTATWQPASLDYLLGIAVRHGTTDELLSQASLTVPPYALLGNLGLFSHPASVSTRFWFQDLIGSGAKLDSRSERAFGPVVSTQYTLSRSVLKLTAQLAPVSVSGSPVVSLETDTGSGWQTAATSPLDPDSYTGNFRIPGWNHLTPIPFRVGYAEAGVTTYRTGTIQPDPVGKPEIVLAGLTCMIHCAADSANDGFNGIDDSTSTTVSWTRERINFPHEDITRHLPKHQPDLLAFTGDQVYEGGSPTNQDNSNDENRRLDYLYKWYLHCWTWRDVIADKPSLTIPDDHDVYQGNLWGEGGKATTTQENGGYTKPPAFVRMSERTQTSHLPDPFDPTPVLQNIGVYYTSWVYGRVGFAIIEDRKFKNGYADEGFGTIGANDPASDTARFNKAGLNLLGDRQETFLDAFAADWAGQDMKAAISQSPFASATTHVGVNYNRIYFDLDAHGWPQNKRDKAVGLLRKSFAPHINGDQHVSVLLQHGITAQRDAVYSFCVPSIANAFSRAWDPGDTTAGTTTTVLPNTGPNLDGFGNRIHMIAVANPANYYAKTTNRGSEFLHDRGPGYGLIRFNKILRTTTFECWPLYADPTVPASGSQYPGWPVTIRQTDNDGRTPTGFLPVVDTGAALDPVVRVYNQNTNELLYGYRVKGNRFRPPVFAAGTYRTEVVTADGATPVTSPNLSPTALPVHAIALFETSAVQIVKGETVRLRWDCPSASAISLDQGIGSVLGNSLRGIGFVEISPTADTTWTLTSTPASGPSLTAQVSVKVLPDKTTWRASAFSPAVLADPAAEASTWGDNADPDGDGLPNSAEYALLSNPLQDSRMENLQSRFGDFVVSASQGVYPVHVLRELVPGSAYVYEAQSSGDLATWSTVPWGTLVETSREPGSSGQTDRVTYRVPENLSASAAPARFHRVVLKPKP